MMDNKEPLGTNYENHKENASLKFKLQKLEVNINNTGRNQFSSQRNE
jgi:hypothetical protein